MATTQASLCWSQGNLCCCLRKVIKSQHIFPSDEAAFKLVYLALRNISKKWTRLYSWLETCAQSICDPRRGSPPSLASRLYTLCLTVSMLFLSLLRSLTVRHSLPLHSDIILRQFLSSILLAFVGLRVSFASGRNFASIISSLHS